MKTMKKVFIALTLFLSVAVLSNSAFALESNTNYEVRTPTSSRTSFTVVSDQEQLDKIFLEENLDVPEGYRLIEVTTTVYNDEDQSVILKNQESRLFDKWTIKNKSYKGEVYFKNDELQSDWFDGPAEVDETYTESVSASFSTSVGIKASVLSSEIGFSVTKSTDKFKTFKTSVKSDEQLNLKVYGNYKKYTYSVYKNNEYQGTGSAYQPKGLIFKQYRFSL